MMGHGSLMYLVLRLARATSRRHGDGIEGFMALARAIAGAVASIEPKSRAIGGGRRRIKRRKARRAKKAPAPIAPVVKKEIPPKPAAETPRPTAPTRTVAVIKVVTDVDSEAIEYAGKSMELTARQARFLALLARATPQPVDRAFLIGRLHPNASAASGDAMLGALVTECRAIVASVGLAVNSFRGVGIALQPAGDA